MKKQLTNKGALYVVATPIGNLKDITLRALEILKEVDLIVAEDTRVTKKLLNFYNISKPTVRYDEHSHFKAIPLIKEHLERGEKVALTTDAGTPGIIDPGARLVAELIKENFNIIPIPGPTALITALSVSGIQLSGFIFLGYAPHKKGREMFFKNLCKIEIRPVVFYESPHRLTKTLESLVQYLDKNQEIVVARELTKIYEEIWRGRVLDALRHFRERKTKGELVLIIP